MKKRKFNFSGLFAIILAILVLAVLVPINMAFSYNNKFFDMTPSSMYTLSDTAVDLIEENSDKEIDIYITFHKKELMEDTSILPLYHTLTQLEEYDNINIIEVIPDENPTLINELDVNNSLNISRGDMIVKSNDIIKKINYSAVFPYDENGTSTYAGEELLTGAIKIVTNGSLPKIYFLTGHGEKSINDSYAQYANYLKTTNNYEAAELNLEKEEEVPDDTAIIFLAGPQTDISKSEMQKLTDYAEKGGAIAFFLSPVEEKVRFENIEDLLALYEIEMQYNVIEETNPNNLLTDLTASELYTAAEAAADETPDNPRVFSVDFTPTSEDSFTEDLTSGMIQIVSEGEIAGISNTRSFTPINANSPYIEKSPVIQTKLNTDTTGISSGYSAISVPCGGDSSTAEYTETLNGQVLYPAYYSYNKYNGSKVLVFGTTDVLEGDLMPQAAYLSQLFSMSSLIWLFDSNMDMNIGNKGVTFDYMSFSSSEEATSVLRIFWIVPFCVAAIGLLVWLKRRHS